MENGQGLSVSLWNTSALPKQKYVEVPDLALPKDHEQHGSGVRTCKIDASPGDAFEVVLELEPTWDLMGANGIYVAVGGVSTCGEKEYELSDDARFFFIDAATLRGAPQHIIGGPAKMYSISTHKLGCNVYSAKPQWIDGQMPSIEVGSKRFKFPEAKSIAVVVSRVQAYGEFQTSMHIGDYPEPGQGPKNHFWSTIFPEGYFGRPLNGDPGKLSFFRFNYEPKKAGQDAHIGHRISSSADTTGATTAGANSTSKRPREESPSALPAAKEPRLSLLHDLRLKRTKLLEEVMSLDRDIGILERAEEGPAAISAPATTSDEDNVESGPSTLPVEQEMRAPELPAAEGASPKQAQRDESTGRASVPPEADQKAETPSDLPCSECNLRFANQSSLTRHHRNMHGGERKIQTGPVCLGCNKSFASNSNLKRHGSVCQHKTA